MILRRVELSGLLLWVLGRGCESPSNNKRGSEAVSETQGKRHRCTTSYSLRASRAQGSKEMTSTDVSRRLCAQECAHS